MRTNESEIIFLSEKEIKTNKTKEKAFRLILNENSTKKFQDKKVNNKYKMSGISLNTTLKLILDVLVAYLDFVNNFFLNKMPLGETSSVSLIFITHIFL